MAPAAQPYLFTTPGDIMDLIGAVGAQLRLDDQQVGTGQTITVSADAALGDTTVFIGALLYPLIKGSTLEFAGGGMANSVEVVLSATARLGATSLTVNALSDVVLTQAIARDSGVNTAFARLLPKACNYGTAEVRRWCVPRYQDSDLATAWSPNDWATTLGSEWVCRRLLRSMPETLKNDCERVREELKMVKYGTLSVEGIGTRSAGWAFMDNTTVNPFYYTHKTRLEPTISDNVPSQMQQWIDWGDALGGAFEW